ncbi:HAAS signaling domain-containing protein [Ornithinibacillus contaminans]|uniref:HAAS signaling domain-containing protein n=1 Tax=Ornithinibacillus contaminans TaxID=694055 RepID=UPI00064DF0D8|nr:membrane protein [Ornithinibacillus contaminans]
MKTGVWRFFQELEDVLGKHPEKEQIMAEYKSHVYELVQEENLPEADCYEEVIKRLGTPEEIGAIWKQESKVTAKKMQILFVVLNVILFLGGIALTVAYNVYQLEWIEILWDRLTDVPSIIVLAYMLFWGLLGYEIGREFGSGGLKVLRKTFTYAIIPNLILMYLIVFKLIPQDWFQPLLNGPFIIVCMLLTIILYPVSWIGYRWGRKASV